MKVIDFEQAKQKRQAKKEDSERPCVGEELIRQVADRIYIYLQITHGDQLVLVLGDGHERTNAEALVTWVRRHIANVKGLTTKEMVEALAKDVARGIRMHIYASD